MKRAWLEKTQKDMYNPDSYRGLRVPFGVDRNSKYASTIQQVFNNLK